MRLYAFLGCVNRTRWIFRLFLFILFVTLVSAIIGYFRMENSERTGYLYFGHMRGPHQLAGALMLGRNMITDDFVPGNYLSGRSLMTSSCNYSFWTESDSKDPWSMLNWSSDLVKPSLELGESSPYRVVYNILNSSNTNKTHIITYCTHATPEFLYHISELLKHWDGSISVTVYAPGEDAHLAVTIIERLCRCISDMHRVSLHITFPTDLPPRRIEPMIELPEDCSPPKNLPETLRHMTGMTYPVNVARNAAREAANTPFVLVSDIELQPSAGLSAQFANLMQRLVERKQSLQRLNPSGQVWTGAGFVYVLPVFEIEAGSSIPTTKEELLKLYSRDRAVFFHRWVCPHCQKFPGLQKWLRRKGSAGFLQPLLVVRREYPFHRWEPVYIGTKEEPFYNEELSWEGQQDKMTQMDAMCLKEYKFVILDRGFLVHSPGVKRKAAVIASSAWRKPHEQRNMQLYRAIIQRILSDVEKPNARCKVQ